MDLLERAFPCPHCGAGISVLLDPSAPEQAYVEDCEVCCRPLEIAYRVEDGEVMAFSADPLEQ